MEKEYVMQIAQTIKAVSYTHLDVYKRQVVGSFIIFFYISLCIRTDSLLQEKSDTLCVACYIKCVKLFFQRTNTNRLEIADNDISISLFTVSR